MFPRQTRPRRGGTSLVSFLHFFHQIPRLIVPDTFPCRCADTFKIIDAELGPNSVTFFQCHKRCGGNASKRPSSKPFWQYRLTFTSLPLTIRESGSALRSQYFAEFEDIARLLGAPQQIFLVRVSVLRCLAYTAVVEQFINMCRASAE